MWLAGFLTLVPGAEELVEFLGQREINRALWENLFFK